MKKEDGPELSYEHTAHTAYTLHYTTFFKKEQKNFRF